MSNIETREVVPCFESVDELEAGLKSKSEFAPVDLYPRDGSRLLGKVETRIAYLNGVEQDGEALAYSSGMAALTDAIDVGLYETDSSSPVLACSHETYTQTKRYIENFLRGKRAQIFYFDNGDNEDIDRVISERQPDVIVSETVSNFVNVPVLDTKFLIGLSKGADYNPTVVLDNTLPLSTALPLGEVITSDDKVIVAESGTKSYIHNSELLGVSYSKNAHLIDTLKRYRRTRGSLPGLQTLKLAEELIPDCRDKFDERNRRLFKSTGEVAVKLAERESLAKNFVFSHPILKSHPNNDFYVQNYPDGATPVFYIQSSDFSQQDVACALWQNEDIRSQARLGQSFGFNHTRIVSDENIGAVRIAGGANTDGEALGEACADALEELVNKK